MKVVKYLAAILLLTGCAGWSRECNSCGAQNFGADWIVVQYKNDGVPIACWKLEGASVANEENSDGIYWTTPAGNLVHISGWYNRVQVVNNDFDGAAKDLGIDLGGCKGGRYIPKVTLDGG